MKLSIYSSENNFINKLLIENNLQNLEIKDNNISYYYTFLFTTRYVETILTINFNLYKRNYINIYFGIEYDIPSSNQSENRSNYTTLYVILGIILVIIIAFAIYKIIPLINKKCKEKKRHKEQLLIAKKKKN